MMAVLPYIKRFLGHIEIVYVQHALDNALSLICGLLCQRIRSEWPLPGMLGSAMNFQMSRE